MLGALWALWHLPELISDPTLQRCRCNSLWILAQFVILPWLYNSTNAILPIVIICHAVINAADRFVLPEFANKNYQVVWSFMVGLYVPAAAIVTLVARPKRRRPAPANPGEGGSSDRADDAEAASRSVQTPSVRRGPTARER